MQEAAVTILMAAAASDGALARQEADRLDALLPSMRLFQQASPEHMRCMMATALDVLGSNGPNSWLPACAELIPEDMRAPLFALAVELVMVDGDVAESETRFVDALKAALTIDDEVAAGVIDVLVMKSRA
jgi:hypothetical protein